METARRDSGRGSPVTWVSLALTAAVGAGVAWYYQEEKERRQEQVVKAVKGVGKPDLGGPWSLVDSNGIPRTNDDFNGGYTLLYFGFTHCPDICPNELVKIGGVVDQLDERLPALRPRLRPIFISCDPHRDTVAQLRNYAQDFHPRIAWLTGTREQVARATRAYRVYFSKADVHEDDEDDYLVDHSIVLYLVDPQGEFVDFFTQSVKEGEIVDRIAAHIEEAARAAEGDQ